MNIYLTAGETSHRVAGSEYKCPYCSGDGSICAASLSQMTIDTGRKSGFCHSENYDCCPIFLARTLRMR